MKNTRVFMKSIYKSQEKELIALVAITIGCGILFHFIPIDASWFELLQGFVIFFLFIKNFKFVRACYVLPHGKSGIGQYSWKYIQALPLSKKDIAIVYILSSLLAFFPMAVWFITFHKAILTFLLEPNEIDGGLICFINIFLGLIPFLVMLGLMYLRGSIHSVRHQFMQLHKRAMWWNGLKTSLIWITSCIYGLVVISFIEDLLNIFPISFVVERIVKLDSVVSACLVLPVWLGLDYLYYQRIKRVWLNEKLSYKKIDWRPKRDLSIVSLCLFLWITPIFIVTSDSERSIYGHDKNLTLIQFGKMKEIESTFKDVTLVNVANKYGVTPLMAAALEGRFEVYRFLESLGARTDGEVVLPKSKYYHGSTIFLFAMQGKNVQLVKYLLKNGFDPNTSNKKLGYSALHMASSYCSTGILEALIEFKVNLHAKNAEGRTALHLATMNNCSKQVVMLIENGMDPLVQDKYNKIALDYLPEWSHDYTFKYYLEKKSRLPASSNK